MKPNVVKQKLRRGETESPLGVQNARDIYALPGCDAIFVGPNDLKFQMRVADGMQFLAISSDLGMLAGRATELAKSLDLKVPDDLARC